MAREAEDIERDIVRKRREIDEDIARLREELLERMDWRWQVRARPLTTVAVALAFGLLAGLIAVRQ